MDTQPAAGCPSWIARLFPSYSIPDVVSFRFGKLLGINSVVLKEESPWIEYFYRSVVPEQHFIPFNKDNVLQVGRVNDGVSRS